jgi:hypothetical protein
MTKIPKPNKQIVLHAMHLNMNWVVMEREICYYETPNNDLCYNRTPNIDFAKTTFETLCLCYNRIFVSFNYFCQLNT